MTPKQIHIKDGRKEYYISIEDILFAKADGNYSNIYLTQHTKYDTIRIQIGQLWKLIEEAVSSEKHSLARIGRSYIIAMKYLQYADPKQRTITLHTDKDVVLENVPREAVKSLLMLLSKDKRKSVLRTDFIEQKVLMMPIDELNDEHLTSNGFEYVDLGLPSGTLWAAQDLNEDGNYSAFFAWGEIYPSEVYDRKAYAHYDYDGKRIVSTSANPNTSLLLPEFDAARQLRGGGWRIPKPEEFEELQRECIMTRCETKDHIPGFLVTGPNGNSIFMPVNGYMFGKEHLGKNACHYWTSKQSSEETATAVSFIDDIEDHSVSSMTTDMASHSGLGIRPVISAEDVSQEKVTFKKALFLKTAIDDIIEPMETMDGWIAHYKNLPVSQEETETNLLEYCEAYKPVVIVAYGAACHVAQRLSSYKRVLVEPDDEPSQDIVSGECWIVEQYPSSCGKYRNCEFIEIRNDEDPEVWVSTFIFPIINEITELNKNNPNRELLVRKKF